MRRSVVICLLAVVALAGCRRRNANEAAATAGNQVATRAARLYFESAAMLLSAEPRNVQLSNNTAAAIPVVVGELLKGPSNPALLRNLPQDTVLRAAYLLPDGTALVDLGGVTLSRGWSAGSHEELMAAYSIVQTVAANFAEVKRVRILINGVSAETLAGHVAIDRSLHPDPTLVDARSQ